MERTQAPGLGYHYFKDIWEHPQPAPDLACGAMWDERADRWMHQLAQDGAQRARMTARVDATAGFLRQNGLLAPGSTVLDIGCGPGLFTVEFAKTAGRVTGADLSPRMIHHAQNHARAHGAQNTDFTVLDFKRDDISALGWHGAFDLVMSCLTPAVTGVDDLHRLMALSRGHCLHVSFVQLGDSLEDRLAGALFGEAPKGMEHWDGRVFYAVFNLLFLEGYNPLTFYFRQQSEDEPALDEALAAHYAGILSRDRPAGGVTEGRVCDALARLRESEGGLRRRFEECYGFLLWDVNQKRPGRTGY